MKLNLLSEQRMRQIVTESIRKVIMEDEMFNDEMYDYDDDEMYSDYGDEAYTWSIYIGEEEKFKSDKTFSTVEEAEQDCENKMEEIGYYDLVKQYNNNPNYQTESGDNYVRAYVDYVDSETGEWCDTMLYHTGEFWMD